jgi:hypothetical protein
MKGNRPDAIPHQIQGRVAPNVDVVGSEEVRAEVTCQRDCQHQTDNSKISLVTHGVCSGLTGIRRKPGLSWHGMVSPSRFHFGGNYAGSRETGKERIGLSSSRHPAVVLPTGVAWRDE